ncbi:MAG: iron-containing alcohol dehydrogenase [Planctomycetia bacterium]|nr:iron-containing alcohol dehydrogenase [Planctomycetia bacterium]
MSRSMDDSVAAYDFFAPPLIRFGAGRIDEIGEMVGLWGRRAWIVGGTASLERSGAQQRIDASLSAAGIESRVVARSTGEPTVDQLAAALAGLQHEDLDGVVVVAVGGGSTIDLAKALAALATNMPIDQRTGIDLDTFVVDHLEGVGRGLAIRQWPLPMVAVPTTAGTGAEATRNAVISCPRRRFKKSMRSPMMVPRAALVDPDLTASCDSSTIAASGLDCVTQLIESFVCRFAKPLPRCLVLESLPRALHSLPRLLMPKPADDDPRRWIDSRAADRVALSHAALLSGLALTNSGLGLAHGVAAALGVACGTPHGVACAVMLPAALRVNREAVQDEFAQLERAVDPSAPRDVATAADAFVERIERLCLESGVPRRLSELGVTADQIDWLAEHSGGASMRGNPVQLATEELRCLLAAML